MKNNYDNYDCTEDNAIAKEILDDELFEAACFYIDAYREWEEKHDLVYK